MYLSKSEIVFGVIVGVAINLPLIGAIIYRLVVC